MEDDSAELLDIVDADGRVVGLATRGACHAEREVMHRAVHVLVFNARGEVFLQKRSLVKRVQPGKWDSSAGGHPRSGESWARAARRELAEELGLTGAAPALLHEYVWRTGAETELVRTYRVECEGPFRLAAGEIDEGRFWAADEIERTLGTGVFTPNFEHEYGRVRAAGDAGDGPSRLD